MIDRRSFTALLTGALAAPRTAWSQMTTSNAVFYASVGPALTLYRIDVDGATLIRQDTVMLPANLQYAWRHPSAPFLYAATSNGGAAELGIKGDKH
jgi:6-phosphogluconolactonase